MRRDIEATGSDLPVPSAAEAAGMMAKPPHPLDGHWYIHTEGETFGPYTGHEMKAYAEEGRLLDDTQVCKKGSKDWTEAGQDPTLKRFFAAEARLDGGSARPPLIATRNMPPSAPAGVVHAGANGAAVQVTNNIHVPGAAVEFASDKSPGLALFLSFIFVGLGQLYNGDVGKGIMMFIGCVLLWTVFLGWIINIWSMVDAYGRAKEQRTRHHVWLSSTRPA